MHSDISKIKSDLENLCNEYVKILEKLKEDGIVTDEVFEKCTSVKTSFLEE